jgi:LemA protein
MDVVETVKGYAVHEKSTFEGVTRLRSAAANATSFKEREQAEYRGFMINSLPPQPM